MKIVTAEIEQTKRVTIEVDVEKHVAAYPDERDSFGGDDVEFVKQGLHEMASDLLDDPPYTDLVGDGMRAVDGYDGEVEISIYGVRDD